MNKRSIHLELADEAATERFGEDLALALKRGDLVALSGDLGVGKSALARALIRAACDDGGMEVPSPTFTLVQSYECDGPLGIISHFDLYRLGSGEELEELGLAEALDEGIALVEWPERAEAFLPATRLDINLHHSGEFERTAIISGSEAILERLERSLAVRRFLTGNWHKSVARRFLLGDASTRTYETSSLAGETRILMNAPATPDGPIISDNKPYSQIAHLAEDVRPFVAIAKVLRERGFEAPVIHAQDLENGFLLLDHMGIEGVLNGKGEPQADKYIGCVEALAALHQCTWPREIPLDDGSVYTVPNYDHPAMMIETDLLINWYAPRELGQPLSKSEIDAFHQIWADLIDRVDAFEKSIVLRDYHSPNILWQRQNTGLQRIGMIDFQDAVMGPCAFDVASLAQDARVTVSAELEQELVNAYIERRRDHDPEYNAQEFLEAYAIMSVQRATKILGIFVRLDERDGKPGYLAHLPRIKAYINRSLKHPTLADLKGWLVRNIGF